MIGDKVRGQCPMGCGETLFIGADDYVTCSYAGCGNPAAAAEYLRHAPLHKAVTDAMRKVTSDFSRVVQNTEPRPDSGSPWFSAEPTSSGPSGVPETGTPNQESKP